MEWDGTVRSILSASIAVHSRLGPGLLESVYEECLAHELRFAHVNFRRQVAQKINYEGIELADAYRMDFVVNESVIVELKAVERIVPLHKAQLMTYLKLAGLPVGLLINFNVPLLKQGVHRVIAPRPRSLGTSDP